MATEQPYTVKPVSDLKPGDENLLPPLSDGEYEALKAEIEKNGLLVAIAVDAEGVIVDGHHRHRACRELGVESVPVRNLGKLSAADRYERALAVNLNRRHLSQKQKRDVIAALLEKHPKWSARRIARAAGVDHKTVTKVKAGENPRSRNAEPRDGKAVLPIALDLLQRIQAVAERKHLASEVWAAQALERAVKAAEKHKAETS